MNYKKIYFTSVKTGIRMCLQAWLEVIADKEFHKEYLVMDTYDRNKAKARFVEYFKNGIFVEA